MEKMEPLLHITITHDYLERPGNELFQIESPVNFRKTLGGPKFPLIRTAHNKWTVLGDREQLTEILERSPKGETIEFDISFTDPLFLYYTASFLPDKMEDDSIRLSQDSPRMNRIKGSICVTDVLLKASCPIERTIRYTSLDKYWKFVLIPRAPGQVHGEIGLEDTQGVLSFNKAEPASFMGKEVFIVTSSQPVKMKDQRYARNHPDISLYEKREFGKRTLLRHIPPPEPGRFLIKELQPNNEMIQIIYI